MSDDEYGSEYEDDDEGGPNDMLPQQKETEPNLVTKKQSGLPDISSHTNRESNSSSALEGIVRASSTSRNSNKNYPKSSNEDGADNVEEGKHSEEKEAKEKEIVVRFKITDELGTKVRMGPEDATPVIKTLTVGSVVIVSEEVVDSKGITRLHINGGWLQEKVKRKVVMERVLEERYLGSGDGANKYYCGRMYGKKVLNNKDGRCGPNIGPQCSECEDYQKQLEKKKEEELLAKQKPKRQLQLTPSPTQSHDDNDDEENISYGSVNQSIELKIGMVVEARYHGWTRYEPGRIADVHDDGTYDVDYDDGDSEEHVPRKLIRPIEGLEGLEEFLTPSNARKNNNTYTDVDAELFGNLDSDYGKVSKNNGVSEKDKVDDYSSGFGHQSFHGSQQQYSKFQPQAPVKDSLLDYVSGADFKQSHSSSNSTSNPTNIFHKQCLSGHPMTVSITPEGGYALQFICNRCREQFTYTSGRWFCVTCKCEFCFECDPAPYITPKCNRNHTMNKCNGQSQGIHVNCEICRLRAINTKEAPYYECRLCKYNICLACACNKK